jgi:HSP20-like domain of unknown function (DUF1813).
MVQHSVADSDISRPVRRAKVGYSRKRHQDPKTLHTRRYSQHPSLVLTGDWLKEAGFGTGVSVAVSVQYGQLTLQVLTATEQGSG